MQGHLFFILSLLFRLITGSPRTKYRVAPFVDLKIEKLKTQKGNAKPRSIIYLNGESKDVPLGKFMDPNTLYELYEMVETGKINQEKIFGSVCVEIFEANYLFPYTPAEWAAYNGQTEVLRTFIEDSEIRLYEQAAVNSIFTNLFALAIQRNKFESLKCILDCTAMDVKGQGFLSIAAQHQVSDHIMNYLLNDCNLKDEIDETNTLNTYLNPLNACIKFNNFKAANLFLKHGASLTLDYAKNDSPLAAIFRLDKYRMLAYILKYFSEYCHVIDKDGDSLYHYAAIYSSKSEMISLINESCPDLSLNIKNKAGYTPLNICFKYMLKPQIILDFISLGADIFHVPDEGRRCPLQIIMENYYETYFTFILGIYQNKSRSLHRVVEYICEKGAWEWLERVLELNPDLPVAWLNFSEATFANLLRSNAWRTFRFFLRRSGSQIPPGVLLKIAENGSREFFKVAVEHGADIEEISEF